MAGVGIHKFNVVACSFALQTEGVTSPHGLLEQEGWRYVMASAPDGVLLRIVRIRRSIRTREREQRA